MVLAPRTKADSCVVSLQVGEHIYFKMNQYKVLADWNMILEMDVCGCLNSLVNDRIEKSMKVLWENMKTIR
jgi:hypothetical protein